MERFSAAQNGGKSQLFSLSSYFPSATSRLVAYISPYPMLFAIGLRLRLSLCHPILIAIAILPLNIRLLLSKGVWYAKGEKVQARRIVLID